MGGFAWVTLATNDSYSLGALVLAHSLKAVGTVQQLAVLVTPGVTSAMRDKLASVFNVVQEVNVLDSRDETNLRLLKRPELGITFTKLHCWRLTQYEKCVFLDADTLVLQNCDELFEREEFSAAPDVGWPDCFNSGVFVYRPSLDTYEKLIQFALEKGSFDGGDQGLLNLYFSDWAHKDISKHLPFIYNMCSTACYSYLPAFKQFGANAKIIHFIGAQKPWLQYFNTETRKVQPSADSSHLQEVLQRWWNIFCSLIHPHLSPAMPQGQLQHGVSPSFIPPQYSPSPNPTSSADDYENAWDPWDEYDQKIAQNIHYISVPTHHIQNQSNHSLNTNASHVTDQPTIHSQPQSQNYNTYSAQNNSFYQPISQPVYQHVPRVPTPPPSPQNQYHQPQYHHQEPQYHNPAPQYHHSEQLHHNPEPPHNPHEEYHQHESQTHHSESHYHHTQHHQHEHHQEHTNHHYPHNDHEQHYEHSERSDNHQHNDHHQHIDYQQNIDQHQHNRHPLEQPHYKNNSSHSHQTIQESFPPDPERPRSPNRPDKVPILPKECEATTTVSNDMSLSSTVEDCSKQDNAGLAGAFAQLTLGVPRTAEQDAFENVLRKQAWEVGNIDYLGKDSFENIWSKITETLSSVPPQPPAAAPESAPEPEPSAPAQSQSQTAPPEEEAKPIQPSVTSTVIPTGTATFTDNSKLVSTEPTPPVGVSILPEAVPLASTEISTPPVPKEIVETEAEVIKKQVEVTAALGGSETDASSPKIPEATKEEAGSQPEAQTTPVTPESQISEKQIEAPSVVSKSVADVSLNVPVEGKAVENIAVESQQSQPQVLSTPQEKEPVVEPAVPKKTEAKEETKVLDPQSVAPETPKEKVSSIEVAAKSVPDKKETGILESQLPKTTETVIAPVCPLPLTEKEPKETEKQSQEASPKQAQELTKTPSSVPPQPTKSEEPASTTTKDSVTLSQTPVQPTAPIPQETTASLDVTATTPSATASSTKVVIKPTLKEAPKAPESSTEVIATSPALKETIKAAPSSAPKTKITEATPPTTPSSPLVEKTKQSLVAESSIPETPPPSEGSSTPTPPPRKTDKPKKVAAKPKK